MRRDRDTTIIRTSGLSLTSKSVRLKKKAGMPRDGAVVTR
jgi:hypothetical protein